jgi:hypothetical protein
MKPCGIQFALAVVLVACVGSAWAQSGGDIPLGDVARNIRKAKVTTKPAEVQIDNDNFSKVMEDNESRRMAFSPLQLSLGLAPGSPALSASPDATCSLSFTAHGLLLSDVLGTPPENGKEKDKSLGDKDPGDKNEDKSKENVTEHSGNDLPAGELTKLEGPAVIVGDSLQLSVYNGTGWEIQEITVGLTILRHPSHATATYDSGRVVPVSSMQIVAKRSDTTLLYHFKGSAAPNSRATFSQPLGMKLGPDQEWHWAIIDAKGIPPKAN